jgi:peptide/nickel transport system permease protein
MSIVSEQLPAAGSEAQSLRIETPWQRFRADFFDSKIAAVSLFILIVIILIALFAPWISPQNPYDLGQVDVMDSRLPPGSESFSGMIFWLGTDGAGRDMWSAIC